MRSTSRGQTRRRFPWWLLLLAFVLVPLAEIFTIVQVGQVVGPWWTIALLLLSGVVGSWLVKREGGRAWRALQQSLQQGRMPARELADGILILIGGTLMLTPGFLSDVVGIAMILPMTRPVGRRLLTGFITRKLISPGLAGSRPGREAPYDGQKATRPGHDNVVPGEVVD